MMIKILGTFLICVFLIVTSTRPAYGQVDSTQSNQNKFVKIDKSAEFPGGMGKFYKFIRKNMRYPKQARLNGIEGKVFVEFKINSDGSIDDESVRAFNDPEYARGGISDPDCQAEAFRLIRQCPNWIPASAKNKPVAQKMVLPISFKL